MNKPAQTLREKELLKRAAKTPVRWLARRALENLKAAVKRLRNAR